MKRRAPLKRTPLAPGKPLQRKTEMPRSGPIKPRRSTGAFTSDGPTPPTPRNGPVKARKPAKPGAAAEERMGRQLVAGRSEGLCEICACAVAREWHHRQNRSQGGTWVASNGMHLCRWDHQFVTEHPEQSYRNGWTVRSGQVPAAVPVLRRGRLVRLDDEGGVTPAEEAA